MFLEQQLILPAGHTLSFGTLYHLKLSSSEHTVNMSLKGRGRRKAYLPLREARKRERQDGLHNLQDLVQHDNVGSLFINY